MKRIVALDTSSFVDKEVLLQGWIHARRDHGKLVFLDLRDRSGIVQVVVEKITLTENFRPESVVEITGIVHQRPKHLVNPNIPTGTVEVEALKVLVISKASDLPFPIDTSGYEINEEIRSKYRYLDIRRPRMNFNLKLRSKVVQYIRNYLNGLDFIEVETPILTKTTPEGARDFIVPSRLQPGKFYALPQSPQQYKQLLMVAGLERYFQIARCFRDEDPRRDRAYGEFTQLDLEMSFVTQEDILNLTEGLFTSLVKTCFPNKHIQKCPWPRLSHQEAQRKYHTDKPDLRKDKKDPDELAFVWVIDYPLFTEQSESDYFHGSGSAKYAPSHHMFTSPHPDDLDLLDQDPTRVRGLQHDLVLNGLEVGGGSIRIHDSKIQEKIFDLIGFSKQQKQEFSHMLTAFTYGVPPHGGIAPGIDRFLMAVLGEPSVREVMAFPTSASGQIAVMDAPSKASNEQLETLSIKVVKQYIKDGNDIYQTIVDLCRHAKISFNPYDHEPVKTSEEAAQVRGTDLSKGVKAILMYGDGKPLLLAVSGDRKIDFSKFKKNYKIKNLRMATPEEVLSVIHVPIGAVPPFGSIFNIPLYLDEKVKNNSTVVFNAGLHTKSISMRESDYELIAKPIQGSFSK